MEQSSFTFPVTLDSIGPKEKTLKITADQDQLETLSRILDVDRIHVFNATVTIKRLGNKRVDARFKGKCALAQTCVVSFKPVESNIELEFQRLFDADYEMETQKEEVELDMADPDLVEPIENNIIDFCHPLIEELSLAVDPFPKAEETDFEPVGFGPEITQEEVAESSPFAVLSSLKEKK